MRLKDVVVLFVAVACASCGGNNPPTAQRTTDNLSAAAPAPGAAPTAAPRAQTAAPHAQAAPASVPADAQWTIFVHAVRGATHVNESRRLKDRLMQSSGLNQWYIIHGSTDSTLYHGYYKEMSGDSADGRRAQADLDKIKAMRDPVSGRRLFGNALIVSLDSPNPEAPPEWDLLNSGGHYTLVIGTYAGIPERKEAAVAVVRELRAQNIPAFYYHGDNASTVSIGAWPASAADEGQAVANRDPTKTVIVATGVPNQRVAEAMQRAAASGEAVTLTPSFTPRDPSMIAMMREYPHLHTNGQVYVRVTKDPATGQQKEVPDPSYIAVIPRKSDSILHQDRQMAQQPDPDRQADFSQRVFGGPQPPAPAEPVRRGQLQSIGD